MIDISCLNNNSIIICPNNIKEFLIKQISKICPEKHIKFLSKKELKDNLYYQYDYEAIYFLHKEYGYNYNNCEEILDNLWSIKPINEKTKKLLNIYNCLLEKKLLKFNKLFKNLFIGKKVYIYGYSKIDLELVNLVEKVTTNFIYLEDESRNYKQRCLVFDNINSEVSNIFTNIMQLIEKGVSLNRIYFYRFPQEYELMIKKYCDFHNLPLETESEELSKSPIFLKYLSLLKEDNYLEAFRKLQDEVKSDPLNVLETLLEIIVKIKNIKEKNDFLDLLIHISKKTYVKRINYREAIKICDANSIINDDDYVFMMGFALGDYPVIYRDIDFYSDKEKEELMINTSKISSEINFEVLSNFILNTKNLRISYKKQNGKKIYYKSLLIDKLNIKEEKGINGNIRYSQRLAETEVASYKDDYKNYGIKNEYLNNFTDEEIEYNKYDNKFKKIPNYYDDNQLILSYTQINEYNKCPFSYFVKRVLKANIFEEHFETNLGILFHEILQDSINKNIKIDDYQEFIDEKFTSNKDKFFLKILLPQVFDVIKNNNKFKENSYFDKIIPEKSLYYTIDNKTKVIGKIDKTMIDEDLKNLIIVDYKTGDYKFNSKKIRFGLDMQLPIYSLLLEENYHDYKNVGMYIQNICLNKNAIKDNPYKLVGLTLNDQDIALRIDKSVKDGQDISDFVKGIKLNKDKTLAKSSTLVFDSELINYRSVAKEQIELTSSKIRNGDFQIAPILFSGEDKKFMPCSYCPCKDICFMKESDIRLVTMDESEEEW